MPNVAQQFRLLFDVLQSQHDQLGQLHQQLIVSNAAIDQLEELCLKLARYNEVVLDVLDKCQLDPDKGQAICGSIKRLTVIEQEVDQLKASIVECKGDLNYDVFSDDFLGRLETTRSRWLAVKRDADCQDKRLDVDQMNKQVELLRRENDELKLETRQLKRKAGIALGTGQAAAGSKVNGPMQILKVKEEVSDGQEKQEKQLDKVANGTGSQQQQSPLKMRLKLPPKIRVRPNSGSTILVKDQAPVANQTNSKPVAVSSKTNSNNNNYESLRKKLELIKSNGLSPTGSRNHVTGARPKRFTSQPVNTTTSGNRLTNIKPKRQLTLPINSTNFKVDVPEPYLSLMIVIGKIKRRHCKPPSFDRIFSGAWPLRAEFPEMATKDGLKKLLGDLVAMRLVTVTGKNQYGEDIYAAVGHGWEIVLATYPQVGHCSNKKSLNALLNKRRVIVEGVGKRWNKTADNTRVLLEPNNTIIGGEDNGLLGYDDFDDDKKPPVLVPQTTYQEPELQRKTPTPRKASTPTRSTPTPTPRTTSTPAPRTASTPTPRTVLTPTPTKKVQTPPSTTTAPSNGTPTLARVMTETHLDIILIIDKKADHRLVPVTLAEINLSCKKLKNSPISELKVLKEQLAGMTQLGLVRRSNVNNNQEAYKLTYESLKIISGAAGAGSASKSAVPPKLTSPTASLSPTIALSSPTSLALLSKSMTTTTPQVKVPGTNKSPTTTIVRVSSRRPSETPSMGGKSKNATAAAVVPMKSLLRSGASPVRKN